MKKNGVAIKMILLLSTNILEVPNRLFYAPFAYRQMTKYKKTRKQKQKHSQPLFHFLGTYFLGDKLSFVRISFEEPSGTWWFGHAAGTEADDAAQLAKVNGLDFLSICCINSGINWYN